MNSQGKISGKLLAVIVVIILLVAGGVYWFALRDTDDDSSTNSTTATSQSKQSDSLDYNGSLASLASAGKARKCTMNYSTSNGSGTGTSYTDGKGKSRLNVVIAGSDGKQSTLNTIVKDGKSYAWFVSGDQTFGYISDAKVPQSDSSTQTKSTPSTPSGTVSSDQKFSMKCVSWSVDNTQFDVPTTINFITLPASSTTQP